MTEQEMKHEIWLEGLESGERMIWERFFPSVGSLELAVLFVLHHWDEQQVKDQFWKNIYAQAVSWDEETHQERFVQVYWNIYLYVQSEVFSRLNHGSF